MLVEVSSVDRNIRLAEEGLKVGGGVGGGGDSRLESVQREHPHCLSRRMGTIVSSLEIIILIGADKDSKAASDKSGVAPACNSMIMR
jgi:hypothetical protein